MNPAQQLEEALARIPALEAKYRANLDRIRAEIDFASQLASARPERADDWMPLVAGAAELVIAGLSEGRSDIDKLVAEAESVMAPMAHAAKEYAVYCAGHAHIDMNWMWSWPETVSVTYDTFSTMDKLMDEFPKFRFSQSQASVYIAMQQYAPELFERVKQRVKEGRWEVTGSQWVEGDKNLAGGEILCRHLLYTRRYIKDALGLDYDEVKIDWEPDTFGHCWTLPGILNRGGVTRYYHHRVSGPRLQAMAAGRSSQLFWWQGKDGSRVLAYDDSPNGYNCEINPRMIHLLFAMERHTGLKCLLWVYGVGDHGGGPTRRHLRAAQQMAEWPIWPQVKLTTTDDYFSTVEKEIAEKGLEIPVHDGELNFVFEGCYTSQSRIKFANRRGECDLADTEMVAALANRLCGVPYPAESLVESWRRSMFIQFHDILPGSGVTETREHCMGLFQENLAANGMIRTRGLRALAERIDTSGLAPASAAEGADMGLGAGVGDGAWWGGLSTLGAGECGGDPFVIFNPSAGPRDELARVKIWNRELHDGRVVVRDATGHTVPGQVLERGDYWGHRYAVVGFPALGLRAVGYRAYIVEPGKADTEPAVYVRETGRPVYGLGYVHAQMANPIVMGNEFVELTVCPQSGGIISAIEKETGIELVPAGAVLGGVEREQEAPHGMTAWQLGAIVDRVEPLVGCVMHVLHRGPHVAVVRLTGKHNDSEYTLEIALSATSPRIDFDLNVNWLERGDPATGVPALRASFPLAVEDGRAHFEIPFGTIERDADGEEAPALNWADLTGVAWAEEEQHVGATLLNDSKYGHQLGEEYLRLTLIRSSYDPDPIPEIGRHEIRYALLPHVGEFNAAAAIAAGHAFNHPVIPVGTTVHEGELPAEGSALEVLTPNVRLAALKRAEDSDALILRLYEFEGEETVARVKLASQLAGSAAVETDLLERPLETNTAAIEGGELKVIIPACGLVTVKLSA